MATVKLNSRSPYFIVAAGTEGCGDIETQSISISGPNTGTVNTDITLSVVANNFTPASYSWTGGAAAGSALKEITFTETSSGAIDYGVTVTSDCGTQFTTSINVSWNTVAQYTATLTVDNQIVGPSAGYAIGGDLNGATVTGVDLDPYSFTTTLALNDGYTADVTLAISPTQPNAGNFAAADASVTTTLTGTVSLDDEYYLARSASSVIEGDTFTITLNTKNVSDGTSVPFTITGVDADDLERNATSGAFVVKDDTATQTFQVKQDVNAEGDETFTLTLSNVTPTVDISVLVRDKNVSQAQTVKLSEANFTSSSLACATNVTTTEDAHYGLAPGETFGNGTILFKDMLLTQRYPSAGKYYKITYNSIQYNAIVGANNQGEITNFAECALPIVPVDETPPEGTNEEDFIQQEEIADTTPTFTCAIAGIEIYDGVVGESLNYSIKNGGGTVTSYVQGSTINGGYVLGSNLYVFNIKIPAGFKEAGSNKGCAVYGTGIAALPTWDCTNTALDVKGGATGESISYSYSSEIKDSDIVSIKNSSGGTVYLAGSNTYTFIHKIPTGYQGAGTKLSCTDTATGTTTPAFTCDIAQFNITNGVEGNSTLANSSVQAGTLTAVSPSTYTAGSDTYTATITIPSGYSNYPGTLTTCTDTANGEEIQLPPSNSVPISSTSIETVGSGGEFPCELELDKVIYYQGTLQNFIQVFNGPELTSPFVGVGNYHHIQIPNPDGELIDWYCRVNFGGIIFSITQCKIDIITDDDGEAVGPVVGPELDNVTVNVTASSSDGTAINSAFTSQKVTLLASVSGLTTTAKYQWYKGTTAAGGTSVLTAISGETNSTLVINDGGETQTSAGTFYYNCLVNDTFEDESNYLIVWDARPSFSLKYYSSQEASISACTGTSVTLYGDRAGVTAFCVAEKFYSNAAGSSSPAIAAGTYSDSTDGTNNNFRYIEANGIPQGCVPYGCQGPPASQPTTGTIQKVYARRCQGQDSPGRYEYFLFDGFEGYLAGQHILDIKDVGQVGGRGCYELIETFDDTYTLPNGYIKIELTDLERQQPYPNCDECLGVVVEEEEEVVIQKYYARFLKCGTDGGNITAVSSTSPISTSLVLKVGNECREYLDDVEITNATDLSLFTTFFGCQACLESITQTVDEQDPDSTLGFIRRYGDCATGGLDVIKEYGSTTDLGNNYPAVILDAGLCLQDLGTSGTTSNVNISTLLSFENCDDCDLAVNPPAPPEPEDEIVINKFTVSSTTETTAANACNNITLFDIKLGYSGTLQDGTYLYTNDTLTNLYTPTSTNFVKSSNGYTFKIGATNPGQVSELKLCNEI